MLHVDTDHMAQEALTGFGVKVKVPSGSLCTLTGSKRIKLPNQAEDNHRILQTATHGSVHYGFYHRKPMGFDVLVSHYTVEIID